MRSIRAPCELEIQTAFGAVARNDFGSVGADAIGNDVAALVEAKAIHLLGRAVAGNAVLAEYGLNVAAEVDARGLRERELG